MTGGRNRRIGRRLIEAAALSTIIIPVGVDGVALRRAHMENREWPAHAKLHCAMSFFAAISLGAGSLALLRKSPKETPTDATTLATATFLATAFWGGLIAAGQWSGTSYNFPDEPELKMPPPPHVAGITADPNVVCAIVSVALGWLGFRLAIAPDSR